MSREEEHGHHREDTVQLNETGRQQRRAARSRRHQKTETSKKSEANVTTETDVQRLRV